MAKSKKSYIWGGCNLFIGLLLIATIVFIYTIGVDIMQDIVNKNSDGADAGEALGFGLGMVFILVFSVPAAILFGVAGIMTLISGIGLLSSGKKGFAVTGAIGKIISFPAAAWMVILNTSFIHPVTLALYGGLALIGIAGGIVDLVMKKKLNKPSIPVVEVEVEPEAE